MARKAARPARRKRGSGIIRTKKGRALPFEAEFPIAGSPSRYCSFQSRSEAERWLDALVKERDQEGRDHIGGAKLFKVFIGEWLNLRATKIGPKSIHNYAYMCSLACGEGELGNRAVESISHTIIDDMITHLYQKGFKSLKQLCTPLKQAFDYAIDRHYIKDNPFHKIQLPWVDHKEIVVLTAPQRRHLLQVGAVEHSPDVPLCLLWHFYSRFGMRKGEGIALRWSDVDWKTRTITIRDSITNVGAENIRGRTKTKKPRLAPLPDDMYAMLEAHRDAQRKRGVFASLFVDQHGETVTPQHVQYRWAELRRRADLPNVTIHGLRHTALYLMALDGVPDNVRMALAGHMTKEMADRYAQHATVADIRKALG